MVRYFIADLHLSEEYPHLTEVFFDFLVHLPEKCELYILGDLFDYWIGDDINTLLHQQVADSLRQLSFKKINTYFVCGNRDFLLGKSYAASCHMQILNDINYLPLNISSQDKPTQKNLIFLHGDLLCTDDISYQKFRKKVHNPWLQRLFLWLPFYFRKRIGLKLRRKSKHHNQIKSNQIMDVNQQAVEKMMVDYHASHMIHGHTHRLATHTFLQDKQRYQRLVLGAWHDGVSYVKQDDTDDSMTLYSHSFK